MTFISIRCDEHAVQAVTDSCFTWSANQEVAWYEPKIVMLPAYRAAVLAAGCNSLRFVAESAAAKAVSLGIDELPMAWIAAALADYWQDLIVKFNGDLPHYSHGDPNGPSQATVHLLHTHRGQPTWWKMKAPDFVPYPLVGRYLMPADDPPDLDFHTVDDMIRRAWRAWETTEIVGGDLWAVTISGDEYRHEKVGRLPDAVPVESRGWPWRFTSQAVKRYTHTDVYPNGVRISPDTVRRIGAEMQAISDRLNSGKPVAV